jgi:hypothetical protein
MFRQHVKDKTNWRDMLAEGRSRQIVDLIAERDHLFSICEHDIKELQQRFGFHAVSLLTGIEPLNIHYPVQGYPEKLESLNFDKQALIEGTLLGIKGQYMIFDTGVINMRRFSGYDIEISSH